MFHRTEQNNGHGTSHYKPYRMELPHSLHLHVVVCKLGVSYAWTCTCEASRDHNFRNSYFHRGDYNYFTYFLKIENF